MRLLDSHAIPHPTGEKRLLLYQGDLSAIPPEEAVDVLVVSAFPDDYQPTPHSLIGALDRRGISVEWLSKDKEIDLRENFSSWISRELSERYPIAGFRRLLCFESKFRGLPTETVGDIFRAVMPFALGDLPIRSIALPILASGDQRYDAETMLRAIYQAAVKWMAAGVPLVEVKLVVYDAELVKGLTEVFAALSNQETASNASAPEGDLQNRDSYDLFISYAHADSKAVDELLLRLRSMRPSARIFHDRCELKAGQSWQFEIDQALESCRRVLAIYSPDYLKSKMCLEEFNMARIRQRVSSSPILLPLFLRSVALPLYMKSLQYLDCREANVTLLDEAANEISSSFM